MALKHRELDELDELDESDGNDEFEFDEIEELDEATKVRRKTNIAYQNVRKKQLKKIGKHHIQIRLDDETFEKLCDLCEVLGYKRPKPKMHNLIEMYSAIFKYLLRTSDENFEYSPNTKKSIKILGIYKYVDHLRYEQQLAKDVIISELQRKDVKIPVGKVDNKSVVSGKDKFLEQYFDKDKIIRVLKMVDDKI
ncbi:hypothetical protein [Rahnella sp. WP5]|uniref:hypothetical protein n=1 Tax=Rahnella sp. WP5 TaxID=1500266 RepID=UPI000566277D|nr:hypothetical protein [Rahnella sp. WP5]